MGAGTKGFALAAWLAIGWLPVAAQESDAPIRQVEEVRLPGLLIGRSFSTWRMSEAPLVVRNTSDDTLHVRVDVVVPPRHELRPGARALPDRAWVTLEARDLVVAPHRERRTDVRLTLPYDPDLAGFTYQVDLACTERRAGAWTTLVRHRLLFSVEMDHRDDTEIDLSFDNAPADRSR
jgi:hypothetical protein